jgi:hypothetical protein
MCNILQTTSKFQYVRLGKRFALDDCGFCLARLEAAQMRLTCWGEGTALLKTETIVTVLMLGTFAMVVREYTKCILIETVLGYCELLKQAGSGASLRARRVHVIVLRISFTLGFTCDNQMLSSISATLFEVQYPTTDRRTGQLLVGYISLAFAPLFGIIEIH